MPRSSKVPMPTLERLATYLRYLNGLEDGGAETISSADIEQATGIPATQFRKDLSYFGEFGRPGIGYDVHDLRTTVAEILKVQDEQKVLLVGAGNLGSALVGYYGLRRHNFNIVAAFDNNPNKIGRQLWDLEISDISRVREINAGLGAQIAILTVPAEAAQSVVESLVDSGVKVILNFAPCAIKVPDGVFIRNVCFIQELTVLSYHLTNR